MASQRRTLNRMAARYKFVQFPTSTDRKICENERIQNDLDAWTSKGWEPVSMNRPQPVGPAFFVFRKDA